MLEKYESKQARICRPAMDIYSVFADFQRFTPLVTDKVDDWAVDGDSCSFRVKGIAVSLSMVEKIPGELIKITAGDSSPFGFTIWLQIKQLAPQVIESSGSCGSGGVACDTRIRLVLHAEMNMMIKMMIGSKIQPALDGMVDQIAASFNAAP